MLLLDASPGGGFLDHHVPKGFPEWLYQCTFPTEQGLRSVSAASQLLGILAYLTSAVLVGAVNTRGPPDPVC